MAEVSFFCQEVLAVPDMSQTGKFCVGHGHARLLAHRWWHGDGTSLGKSCWVRSSG